MSLCPLVDQTGETNECHLLQDLNQKEIKATKHEQNKVKTSLNENFANVDLEPTDIRLKEVVSRRVRL